MDTREQERFAARMKKIKSLRKMGWNKIADEEERKLKKDFPDSGDNPSLLKPAILEV